MRFYKSNLITLSFGIVFFISIPIFSLCQYETSKSICGGWFKSVQGSIQFNSSYTENTGQKHVCVWTISGSLPSQYSRYNIKIGKSPSLPCDPDESIGVSFFDLYSRDVTSTRIWKCADIGEEWPAMSATLFFVVYKTTNLKNATGFNLEWSPSGNVLPHGGVRTTAYTWGRSSVDPLPYYASGFFTNEVATHVFPKGNRTNGYEMELEFENIEIDRCGDEGIGVCTGNNSSMLVLSIESSAILKLRTIFTEGKHEYPTFDGRSEWGMIVLVWAGEFSGAGGKFQLVYRSIRM